MTIALVTGANRGLGYEAARRLVGLGWTVLVGARDASRGQHAAAQLATSGGDARFVRLDVTSDESVAGAADFVGREYGRLDVLVNNAGVPGRRGDPLDTTADDFLPCLSVNLLGPVRVTRAFAPLLERSDLPRVVMVSSGMGSMGVTTDPSRFESSLVSLVYPASKAALTMVTTQYAKSLSRWKINAVDPGYTATDFNSHRGHKSVEEGAEIIVRMATVTADGPTGGFFDDKGVVPW